MRTREYKVLFVRSDFASLGWSLKWCVRFHILKNVFENQKSWLFTFFLKLLHMFSQTLVISGYWSVQHQQAVTDWRSTGVARRSVEHGNDEVQQVTLFGWQVYWQVHLQTFQCRNVTRLTCQLAHTHAPYITMSSLSRLPSQSLATATVGLSTGPSGGSTNQMLDKGLLK